MAEFDDIPFGKPVSVNPDFLEIPFGRPVKDQLAAIPAGTDLAPQEDKDILRRLRKRRRTLTRKQELGYIEEVTRGLGRLGARKITAYGGILEMVGFQSMGRKLRDRGRRMSADPNLQPSESVATGDSVQLTNPRWWTSVVSEEGPQLLQQLGLAYAARGVGRIGQITAFAAPTFTMEGGLAFDGAFESLRSQGASEEAATAGATAAGVVTGVGAGVLDSIPYSRLVLKRIPGADRILAKSISNRILNGFVGRAVQGAAVEGPTEIGQEAWSDLVQFIIAKDPDAFANWLQRYKGAGTIGAILGGAVDSATGRRPLNDDVRTALREQFGADEITEAAVTVPPSDPEKAGLMEAENIEIQETLRPTADTAPAEEAAGQIPNSEVLREASTPNPKTPEGQRVRDEMSGMDAVNDAG